MLQASAAMSQWLRLSPIIVHRSPDDQGQSETSTVQTCTSEKSPRMQWLELIEAP